jgi:hypothetical protein
VRHASLDSLVLRVVAIVILIELLVDKDRSARVAHIHPLGVTSATVGVAVVVVSFLRTATRLRTRLFAFHELLTAIGSVVSVQSISLSSVRLQCERDVVWVVWGLTFVNPV